MPERVREHRSDLPSAEEVESRSRDGWELVAVEWQRPSPAGSSEPSRKTEVPYGLQPSADGLFLESNREEEDVLRFVLSGLVDDRPLSRIAAELNDRGIRTRRGNAWRQGDLFDMLPRIVEAGADILRSEAWSRDRGERRAEIA